MILALLLQPEQPNFTRLWRILQQTYHLQIYSFQLHSHPKKPLHTFYSLHDLHSRSTIKLTNSPVYSASKFTDSGISVPLLPTFYQDLISHSVSPCDKRTSAPVETRLCHLSDQLTLTCQDLSGVFGYWRRPKYWISVCSLSNSIWNSLAIDVLQWNSVLTGHLLWLGPTWSCQCGWLLSIWTSRVT